MAIVSGFVGSRISFNSTAEAPIASAAIVGAKMHIRRLRLSVSGATNITVRDSANGNILEIIQFPAAGMLILDDGNAFSDGRGYYGSAIGGVITLQSSVAVQVEGRVVYNQDFPA